MGRTRLFRCWSEAKRWLGVGVGGVRSVEEISLLDAWSRDFDGAGVKKKVPVFVIMMPSFRAFDRAPVHYNRASVLSR